MVKFCPYRFKEELIKYGASESEARATAWLMYFDMQKGRLSEFDEDVVENAKYPWDKCVSDQTKKYGSISKAKKICGYIKAKYGSNEHAWGPKTERCIQHLKTQGKDKSSAIAICRKATKDK